MTSRDAVRFTVRGATKSDIDAKVLEVLASFSPEVPVDQWQLMVDYREDLTQPGGGIVSWKADVTGAKSS